MTQRTREKREPLDSDERDQRMYAEVALQCTKENSSLHPMSREESEQWDRYEVSMAEMRKRGFDFDMGNSSQAWED